ncbi:para-aminobenzoate synthase [Daedalea quercina L-15889]|uniref:aminodeoxychorismate synthase n=1 Tax=Daedalea quercina L-15889 TaxID=1314783 RepID=A0A165ULI6_9APHY|nr:para-aminobenzoate synthase [Daedalea quercina L-15889]
MTVSLPTPGPRILLIDSYDSFTYNLAALCRRSIPGCSVHIVRNDDLTIGELRSLLDHFSAIVVGPGPGSPDNDDDIGVVRDIWRLSDGDLLPVFGVCLGLQSLAVEFGAKLHRLDVVKHGQISNIRHSGTELFAGVGDVAAVRYHSLHVSIDGCDNIEALAWADDGEENGKVIMAAKHRSKPFWAVQYHPESVRTEGGGEDILRNFWQLAVSWASKHRREVRPWSVALERVVGPPWPVHRLLHTLPPCHVSRVTTRVIEAHSITPTVICERLGVLDESSDFVLLDSAAQPGRFSIVGCLTPSSTKITHYLGNGNVDMHSDGAVRSVQLGSSTIWDWLADFMRSRRAEAGVGDVPFWGGLVGYLSYELGTGSLSPDSLHNSSGTVGRNPDVDLVFVERSIVIDAASGKVYIQTLLPDDEAWLQEMVLLVKKCPRSRSESRRSSPAKRRRKSATTAPPTVNLPDREQYISRIREAKEYLFSGDSYELCLTAPTHISVPKAVRCAPEHSSSWELYKVLRSRNPAPHSAYIRLRPSTLLSSSPERFLSYSRPPHSICQLRPIKGTVRKAPGITRAVAEQALAGSVKEVAENLMIVDLIRHDLHGVVGEDVEVKQFCKVEEYKTVWQLVSVIEGKLPGSEHGSREMDLGWEVLRRSLPPGSMTGAPKKRSVEILRTLEDHPRDIYSGVFGYWDVGGGGDWSVTIRSCFKNDMDAATPASEKEHTTERWTLGAGGAITALSDPEAEWEEMIVKVESVIRAFGEVEFS